VARARSRLLEAGAAALLLAVFAWIAYSAHRRDMVRPKVLFVVTSFRSLQSDFAARAKADPHFVMPWEIPDRQTDWFVDPGTSVRHEWETSYADPFDRRRRVGASMLECVVRQDHMNGDPVNFTFRGNKLKYLRTSDTLAVVYSFGPDEDDDLGEAASTARLSTAGRSGAEDRLAPTAYDSTNGTLSGGDIFRVVDLQEFRDSGV
jgi:hypothetical protein